MTETIMNMPIPGGPRASNPRRHAHRANDPCRETPMRLDIETINHVGLVVKDREAAERF
jgi:hypothetical protein